MEKYSLASFFFWNYRFHVFYYLCGGSHVEPSLLPKFALLFCTCRHAWTLRAWSDDLNVVLFEFLEDDTKLAQSCTDWLYVQHWYTVAPDPAMPLGAGGEQAGIVTSTFIAHRHILFSFF